MILLSSIDSFYIGATSQPSCYSSSNHPAASAAASALPSTAVDMADPSISMAFSPQPIASPQASPTHLLPATQSPQAEGLSHTTVNWQKPPFVPSTYTTFASKLQFTSFC